MTATETAGVAAACGLGGIGALHAYWAAGGLWPGSDREELGALVVGEGAAVPAPAATLGVAALMGVAAAAVGVTARGGGGRWTRRATQATAFALLARGAVGPVFDVVGAGAATRFARMDLRVYSPLCLTLGGAVAAVAAAGCSRAGG